jgi:hypothetical protein
MLAEVDPIHLTPSERRAELAALLATGIRRLRDERHSLAAPFDHHTTLHTPTIPQESQQNRLDLVVETSVTVTPRLTDRSPGDSS